MDGLLSQVCYCQDANRAGMKPASGQLLPFAITLELTEFLLRFEQAGGGPAGDVVAGLFTVSSIAVASN